MEVKTEGNVMERRFESRLDEMLGRAGIVSPDLLRGVLPRLETLSSVRRAPRRRRNTAVMQPTMSAG